MVSKALAQNIFVIVIGLVLCYLSADRIGQFFVLSGYPADTCWLLKTGELIVRTGCIPDADPFSYTLAAIPAGDRPPYVVYQWFSEVLFFCGKYFFDYGGLMAVGATVMALGAIVLPLHAGFNTKSPLFVTFGVVASAAAGCISRCVLRPELFSLVFLSTLLLLLQKLCSPTCSKGFQRLFLLLVACLFLPWVNMHSGFITGLIILTIYATAYLGVDLFGKKDIGATTKTLLWGLLVAFAMTFVNPYGVDLWLYLPHLFFARVNQYILELRPSNVLFMNRPVYLYYFATLIASFLIIAITVRNDVKKRAQPLTARRLAGIVVIASCAVSMFKHSRFISYIVLIAMEALQFFPSRSISEAPRLPEWKKLILFAAMDLSILFAASFGVLRIADRVTPVLVPSPRANYRPPLAAMVEFQRIYASGRIFASAEIGSAIELYLCPFDSVFLDTRLDGYPMSILTEYDTIMNARPGYKELLDRYKVQWIFVSPTDLIAPVILRDKSWKVIVKDEMALILCRPTLPSASHP